MILYGLEARLGYVRLCLRKEANLASGMAPRAQARAAKPDYPSSISRTPKVGGELIHACRLSSSLCEHTQIEFKN